MGQQFPPLSRQVAHFKGFHIDFHNILDHEDTKSDFCYKIFKYFYYRTDLQRLLNHLLALYIGYLYIL